MIEKYKLFYRTFIVLFWIMMCWGFVSEEFLPFLSKLTTFEMLFIDGAFALFGFVTIRNKGDIAVLVTFLVIGVISTIYLNGIGWYNFGNGFRDFVGIIFVVPVIRWFFRSERSAEFVRDFDKQLKIWLYVQAFCLTWQFIRYGANDAGGGSFGYGSSGMVSTLIYLISFYLLSKNWDSSNAWKSIKENKEYLILLYPTFLNETKISFIYLMLYMLLLIKFDRTVWIKAVFLFPVFGMVMALLFSVYLDVTDQEGDEVLTWEFLSQYFFSGGQDFDYEVDLAIRYFDGDFDDDLSVEWWNVDLPRYAKVVLAIPVVAEEKGGAMFGTGVGTLKSGKVSEPTRFARQYEYMLFGTRIWPLFLYVSLGVLGIIWWIWAYCRIAFMKKVVGVMNKRVLLFLNLQILMIFFYSDFIRAVAPMVVFIFILFELRQPVDETDNQKALQERKFTPDLV
ncbi:MAG: hypothetical protein K2I56_07540 [Muribaculaceae bacterium]|nr:hypothetical protein [Muribaculaceae bacterium]